MPGAHPENVTIAGNDTPRRRHTLVPVLWEGSPTRALYVVSSLPAPRIVTVPWLGRLLSAALRPRNGRVVCLCIVLVVDDCWPMMLAAVSGVARDV